ncbi:MAG: DUF1822 family protein [Leptolyngbya sp. SIO4C5]|nr:DUF1822 family protein [Leptolyngbya sp. SIO4C5]
MSLGFENPVQPVLALPPDLAVWQQCQSLAEPAERWRRYLHQIGLAALRPWFQEEFGSPVHGWPAADAWNICQVVDGLALTLGQRRIVVLLSETIDTARVQVPQEWIDIPGWTADYYVAAHVDVDAQRLVLWGYAPYTQVKTQGAYEPRDRTYSLSDIDLIQDFSVFWVAQQLEQPQTVSIPALPLLPAAQAESLIERLAGVVEPRLEIPFGQWGALLSQERWRQQLWQRRQGIVPVDLSRWVSQLFEPGWRSLESLLPQTPALGFRSAAMSNEAISRGKPIVLDPARGELVLVLRVTPAGDRRRISIQLFPLQDTLLPSGVILGLELPDTARQLQTVQAGEQDNYIQIPSFHCPTGQRFRVSLQLGDAILRENFIS